MKKAENIWEIICPICGEKPVRVSDPDQIYTPEFYCKKDKIKLLYERETSFFGKDSYAYRYSQDVNFCEKHNRIYNIDVERCSECQEEIEFKEFKKLRFTKKQLEFIDKTSIITLKGMVRK